MGPPIERNGMTDSAHSSTPDRGRRVTESVRHDSIPQAAPGPPETSRSSLEYRCRQLTTVLRDTLGPDGSAALLSRTLAECERAHPVLALMRGSDGREIQLDCVSVGIERYGLDAAEAGVEAMITSLLGILGKLIGEDMAMRLLDLDAGDASRNKDAP